MKTCFSRPVLSRNIPNPSLNTCVPCLLCFSPALGIEFKGIHEVPLVTSAFRSHGTEAGNGSNYVVSIHRAKVLVKGTQSFWRCEQICVCIFAFAEQNREK